MILNGKNSPWQNKNLTYLFKIVTGSTPSTKSESFWKDGNVLWVTPTDLSSLGNNVFISNSERKITNQALSHSNLTLLPIDSIILSTRAPVGYVAINKKELCFNQGCKALVIKDEDKTDSLFYYYYFLFIRNYLESISGGSTFKELSKDSLKNLSVPLPDISEQTAIANILSTVDEAIQKADEAITKTERIKQAMMQKLLSEGIGHKEFKKTKLGKIPNNWKEFPVKEIFRVETGTTPSTKIKKFWQNGTEIWITPADLNKIGSKIYISDSERKITLEGISKTNLSVVPENSLILSTRAPVGYTAINSRPVTFNQGCKALVHKEGIKTNVEFYYYLFLKIKQYLENISGGSTFKELSKNLLENIRIPLPNYDEQHKI